MAANRRFSRASKSRRTPAAFPISHETQNRALKCRYITRLSIGGDGFAVSRYAAHRQEAITLVRFLLRAQIQASEKESDSGGPPAQPEFYDPLSISNSNVDVIES